MAALGEGVRAAFHFYFTAGYPETQRLLVDVVRLLVITRSSAEALPWVFRAWVLRGNILAPELLLSQLGRNKSIIISDKQTNSSFSQKPRLVE